MNNGNLEFDDGAVMIKEWFDDAIGKGVAKMFFWQQLQ